MATIEEELINVQNKLERPIPGSSLAQDPDNAAPYEKAPTYTSVHAATEDMFMALIEKEKYMAVMEAVDEGVPVLQIAQMILFEEFQKGSFNPDLMMMMVEPTIYIIIALAERLELDIVIDKDDENDEEVFGTKFKEKKLEALRGAAKSGIVPQGVITPVMAAQMEELPETLEETSQPEESLLQAPAVAEEPVQNTQSLMAKG